MVGRGSNILCLLLRQSQSGAQFVPMKLVLRVGDSTTEALGVWYSYSTFCNISRVRLCSLSTVPCCVFSFWKLCLFANKTLTLFLHKLQG